VSFFAQEIRVQRHLENPRFIDHIQSQNVYWLRSYCGTNADVAQSTQQTIDGGYIVAGYTYSYGAGNEDAWVLKTDSEGKIEWQKTYGGSFYDYLNCICQTSDGGYIAAGVTYSFGAGSYMTHGLSSLTPQGGIQWQYTYGSEESDSVDSIIQTSEGGYIATGNTSSSGNTAQDLWILKITSKGEIEWQKVYKGSEPTFANSIQQTPDNGYIVAGCYGKTALIHHNSYAMILKLDSNGQIEWQKILGTTKQDCASCIKPIADGGFIVSGYSGGSPIGGADVFLLKISPSSEIGPCALIQSPDIKSQNTNVVPNITNTVAIDINLIRLSTNVYPNTTNASSELLCWNLNQPPENITVKQDMNRSLFRKEYYNTITWSPNSQNNKFSISEYRIYNKYGGEYQLIGTVPANMYVYVDGPVDPDNKFIYAITSVDSEGRESPKSR